MVEAKQLCDKYTGEMTIVKTTKLQEEFFSQMKMAKVIDDCERVLWTGFSDEAMEDNFVDVNQGRPIKELLDPIPFATSQPNGGNAENCVVAWTGNALWYDTRCHRTAVSFCKIDANPRLQMRGDKYLCHRQSMS